MLWWESLQSLWTTYIEEPFSSFTFIDALDILLLAIAFYFVVRFIKGRRAAILAIGVAIIIGLYGLSGIAGLRALHEVLAWIAPYTVILIAIIFQAELRDVLEKLGSTPRGFFLSGKENRADISHTISEVVDAACRIAQAEEDGALIVIEGVTPLQDYIAKGHELDASVSSNLLRNIFVDRSPLHDGAVIISKNRIASAGCKLPLTGNEAVVRGMGTRHRAAVGITEVSDCVVIVVSEERHVISIANNGYLKRGYNHGAAELKDEATLKAVQNNLRNDLFLLLTGVSGEAAETGGKKKGRKRTFRQTVRFDWRFRAKKTEETPATPAPVKQAPVEPRTTGEDPTDTSSQT